MKKINELINFLETCEHQKQLQVETQTVLKYCKEIQAEQLALCSVTSSLPTRRSKNNLPEDTKLNFVKTTLMMSCIENYERAIIDEDEFIKRIRQIEKQYK